MSDDKGWTMLAGDEDADAMVERYIAARTPKGTRPLHAELRAENDHLRLSLLTMAARERETAADRDALRVMLAEARERSVGHAAFDAIDAENTRLRSLLSRVHGAVGALANSHLLREDKLQAIAHYDADMAASLRMADSATRACAILSAMLCGDFSGRARTNDIPCSGWRKIVNETMHALRDRDLARERLDESDSQLSRVTAAMRWVAIQRDQIISELSIAKRERDRLQARLAGSTVPPTVEDLLAHDGAWMVLLPDAEHPDVMVIRASPEGVVTVRFSDGDVMELRRWKEGMAEADGTRWWPIGRDGLIEERATEGM